MKRVTLSKAVFTSLLFSIMVVAPFVTRAEEMAPVMDSQAPAIDSVQPEVLAPEVIPDVQIDTPAVSDAPAEIVPDQVIKPVEEGSLDGGGELNAPSALMGGSSGTSSSGQSLNQTYSGAVDAFSRIDEQTGAFTYDYPLEVPAGRNGMQPDLRLQYSSNALKEGGIAGYGWDVAVPSIERLNKSGLESLYTSTTFSSSLAGGELIPDVVDANGYGTYLPRLATTNYVKFEYLSSGSWKAIDSMGRIFTFGVNTSAKLSDPANATKVYRWYVESIIDPNANGILYTYITDGGQIYLDNIEYTTNGTTAGYYDVKITYETRPDAIVSADTGFKITFNKRIDKIEVFVNNVLRKKFDFSYVLGSNGNRSLLSDVILTGYDVGSSGTALPALSFSYTNSDVAFQESDRAELSAAGNSTLNNMRFADINGDGYVDALSSFITSNYTTNYFDDRVYINSDGIWTEDTTWTVPIPFVQSTGNSYDHCANVIDVNGDALADIVYKNTATINKLTSGTYAQGVYINNGTGWTSDTTWTVPIDLCNGDHDLGVRFANLNGDGLIDMIKSEESTPSSVLNQAIYLNNGHGWDLNTSITKPTFGFVASNGFDAGVRIADVNGDGLSDLIKSLYKDNDNNPNIFSAGSAYVDKGVYINTGSQWELSTTWDVPAITDPFNFIFALDWNSCNSCSPNDYGTRLGDFNGDGLTDLMDYDINPSFPEQSGVYYFNNGESFVEDTSVNLPSTLVGWGTINCSLSPWSLPASTLIMDINGDGIDDYYLQSSIGTDCVEAQIAQGPSTEEQSGDYVIAQDLLQTVNLPTGGAMSVTYYPSAHYEDSSGQLNDKMRFLLTTVKTITFDDGLSTAGTYTYEYAGGEVYYSATTPEDKKFAGFKSITMTRPDGGKVTRYFHQNNGVDSGTYEGVDTWGRIGRMYRQETKNASAALVELQINTWQETAVGTGSTFIAPDTEMHLVYDGDTDHKDTLVDYTHDATTGNLTYELYLGEVLGNTNGTYADTGNDSITKEYVYATHATGLIRGMVQTEYTRNTWLDTTKQTRFYYDGITYLGTVIKGNVTKKAEWITGATYEDTTYVYDTTYGLVTSSTDPEAAVTTVTYDTQKLYPLTVTNDLSQATSYTYDYATGKVLTTTDPNGAVFETVYDGLGRPITEKQPIVAGGGTENVRTYTYVDTAVPTSVKVTNWMDGSNSFDKYTYYDGFGRPIQTRAEHETTNTFSVADTIYDTSGRVTDQSLPYNVTGSAYTSPTTTSTLLETYTYDTLDRVTTVENAAGTTSSTYDQWIVIETDANGEVKEYTYDWRKLLISVKETIGGVAKTTTYTYNTNGNLLSYTDSLGNVRNFTYDGRLQRLTAQDLHATSDTSYGTWTYTYNKTNNILTTTDANGKVITNTYDDLHRILTENDPATTGTDVTYTYDTCTKGVGRLCSVTGVNGVTTAYTYDYLGRVATVAQTIDSVTRTTTYTYDRQGNVLVQAHPDGSKNEFTYGTAGRTSLANWRDPSGTSHAIMTYILYAPTGAPQYVMSANGAETVYVYDAEELYRLRNKSSLHGSTALQDLNYTYDPVGNITLLVDINDIYGEVDHVMTYDDVHRLTSIISYSADANLDGNVSYTYDSVGNILTGPLGSYTYNSTGTGIFSNPHAATTVGGVNYTYDKNGNQLTDGTWTNTWDFKNRLITSAKTGNTVSYTYDHLGNRVKKTDTTVAVPTYYVTPEYQVEGSVIRHDVSVPGVGSFATVSATGTTYTYVYHLTDHLGSTNIDLDASGAVLQYLNYEPFGQVRYNHQSGSWNNDEKYTGKEQDTETNWQYFGARYYNNSRGQFMSADPVFLALGSGTLDQLRDPQFYHSYAYGRNNPYKMIDPDGMAFWDVVHAFNRITRGAVNIATAMLPGVSDYRDFVESVSGRDMMTGQSFNANQMSLTTGALLVPGLVSGSELRTADRMLGGIGITESTATSPVIRNVGETTATRLGREMHRAWDYGAGFTKEFTIPGTRYRVDAINFDTHEIVELKPNNERAIRSGMRQLEKYRDAMQNYAGGEWKIRLETYKKN